MESAAGKQAVKEFFIQIRKSFNEMVISFTYIATSLTATWTFHTALEVY